MCERGEKYPKIFIACNAYKQAKYAYDLVKSNNLNVCYEMYEKFLTKFNNLRKLKFSV